MAEEPVEQALPESPPDLLLDNQIPLTDPGEGETETEVESDDGETVETEDEEDADEPERERGPIPYNRFRTVNEEKKRLTQALEKAGYRMGTDGEPVAIGDGWDTETDETEVLAPEWEAQNTGQRPINPNEWDTEQWHDYARERNYDPDTLDRNLWTLVGQQALSEAQQTTSRRQQQETYEQQARTYIDTAITSAGDDPYLSTSTAAVSDLKDTIRQARANGIPYSQIARDMPYLQARSIVAHLPEIIEAAGGKVAKATVERRQRLTSQSPASSTATVQTGPKITHDVAEYARQTGISADRLAAELQKIKERDR